MIKMVNEKNSQLLKDFIYELNESSIPNNPIRPLKKSEAISFILLLLWIPFV